MSTRDRRGAISPAAVYLIVVINLPGSDSVDCLALGRRTMSCVMPQVLVCGKVHECVCVCVLKHCIAYAQNLKSICCSSLA